MSDGYTSGIRKGQPRKAYAPATFKFPDEPIAPPATVAAVVLAAGRGSRFGGDKPKPLARLGPRSMLAHAIGAAAAGGLRPVVVVVGYRAEEVAIAAGPMVRLVENPDWEEGMATSLRAGLAALAGDEGVVAAAVALADQPRIGPEAYRRVTAARREGAGLVVATYDGVWGHPVVIGREHWPEAMSLSGDEGARSLLEKYDVVEVPCDDTGSSADVDTPEDLEALNP
ncbi:MAG: nucleotidyltransferase family protein [Acidimicrobiia bacterium]